MRIGILAVQGDFREHKRAVESLGAKTIEVRTPNELNETDGLIIPGGESTVISRLLRRWGRFEEIRSNAINGYPLFGTCAGMILLAKSLKGSQVKTLELMDITVRRNAYGRQIESFEAELKLSGSIKDKVKGVFIRAPQIVRIGNEVEIISSYQDRPVIVRQENMLASSFHPELTDNSLVHKYFLEELVSEFVAL